VVEIEKYWVQQLSSSGEEPRTNGGQTAVSQLLPAVTEASASCHLAEGTLQRMCKSEELEYKIDQLS
jgi:hypothetical protein